MSRNIPNKLCSYPISEHGNFYVLDTINVPHSYCIGALHVAHAANKFCGILSQECIEHAERYGIHCAVKGCKLPYNKHETALLIKCNQEIKNQAGHIKGFPIFCI